MRNLAVFLLLFLFALVAWSSGIFASAAGLAPAPAERQTGAGSPPAGPAAVGESPPAQAPGAGITPRIHATPGKETARAGSLAPGGAPRPAAPGEALPASEEAEAAGRPFLDEPIQRLAIPALKVSAGVVEVPFEGGTWDVSSLGQDLARLGDLPGQPSGANIVLAGHVTVRNAGAGPFYYLSRLKTGERVILYTTRQMLTFQVTEQRVVRVDDTSVLAPSEDPRLTLITCDAWNAEEEKFQRRRAVIAELVRVEPLGSWGVD